MVDEAIAIVIKTHESLESVGCLAPIWHQCVVAKKFSTMVNGAVAIKITHQEAISGADPTCPFGKAVAIMIEIDTG